MYRVRLGLLSCLGWCSACTAPLVIAYPPTAPLANASAGVARREVDVGLDVMLPVDPDMAAFTGVYGQASVGFGVSERTDLVLAATPRVLGPAGDATLGVDVLRGKAADVGLTGGLTLTDAAGEYYADTQASSVVRYQYLALAPHLGARAICHVTDDVDVPLVVQQAISTTVPFYGVKRDELVTDPWTDAMAGVSWRVSERAKLGATTGLRFGVTDDGLEWVPTVALGFALRLGGAERAENP